MRRVATGPRWRDESGETGSATVLAVGALGALVAVTTGALLVVATVRDVHRARSAADLSALAAASPLRGGGPPDCVAAGGVASANGAELTGCVLLPEGSVEATVVVRLRGSADWFHLPVLATTRARAGVLPGDPP